jgi:hypothetical protein
MATGVRIQERRQDAGGTTVERGGQMPFSHAWGIIVRKAQREQEEG